jgi:hypothetical protein
MADEHRVDGFQGEAALMLPTPLVLHAARAELALPPQRQNPPVFLFKDFPGGALAGMATLGS